PAERRVAKGRNGVPRKYGPSTGLGWYEYQPTGIGQPAACIASSKLRQQRKQHDPAQPCGRCNKPAAERTCVASCRRQLELGKFDMDKSAGGTGTGKFADVGKPECKFDHPVFDPERPCH